MSFQVEIDKKIKSRDIYFVGESLPSDWYAAFRIWKALAEQGDMKAQLNTGWCYAQGEGIEQDLTQAKAWLLKAAGQDCPKANWYLSHDVFGLDAATRTAFFEKAVALGEPRATQRKDELLKKAERDREDGERKRANEKYQSELKDISEKFDGRDYLKTTALLDDAIARGYPQLKGLRALLDISIESISVKQKSRKGGLVSGGVVQGTTQVYQEMHNYVDIQISVRNSSQYPAYVVLRSRREGQQGDGEGEFSFGSIPAGEVGKISREVQRPYETWLVPFMLVNLDGHEFRVPIPGYRKTRFPVADNELKNTNCFVLTACYGDGMHPTVVNFRGFRDKHLARFALGRAFITYYYKHGPKAASFIKDKPQLKKLLRAVFAIIDARLPK